MSVDQGSPPRSSPPFPPPILSTDQLPPPLVLSSNSNSFIDLPMLIVANVSPNVSPVPSPLVTTIANDPPTFLHASKSPSSRLRKNSGSSSDKEQEMIEEVDLDKKDEDHSKKSKEKKEKDKEKEKEKEKDREEKEEKRTRVKSMFFIKSPFRNSKKADLKPSPSTELNEATVKNKKDCSVTVKGMLDDYTFISIVLQL